MLALLLKLYEPLPQPTVTAQNFDRLYGFIYYFCLISFVVSVAAIVYFIVRYRRSKSDPTKTPYIHGNTALEGGVIVGLFVVVMIIFYWGWQDYQIIRKKSPGAIEINVSARQWAWDFQYATNGHRPPARSEVINGKSVSVPEIVVPKGKPVRLIMTSTDVIHSFYIPDFRIKQDVVPGTYTTLSFTPLANAPTESHYVFCAEYCGIDHSMMMAKIKVVEPADYETWQKNWELTTRLGDQDLSAVKQVSSSETKAPVAATPETPAERGKKVFAANNCSTCHSVDGKPGVGPTLKGVFGSSVELVDGSKVTADENYVRESLTQPQAKIVKGFSPMMPTYQGTIKTDEITDVIAYLKSIAQ